MSMSMSIASSSYWGEIGGEAVVVEKVGGRGQGQGAGRVGFGKEKEVGCEWVEAGSDSAEQKFMSLRAKRALGDGSSGAGSVHE
jgi:hypothetical protein